VLLKILTSGLITVPKLNDMKKLLWFCSILILAIGCAPKSKYEQLKARELAKGIREDSLFLGLYLGMSKKDFYDHCTELNKQRILTIGTRKVSTVYKLEEGLDHPALMNFYPNFYDGKIAEMPVSFNYEAWAPWNKDLWSTKLLPDVVHMLEEWYGKGFIKVERPKRKPIFVKIDGNRRIIVSIEDDTHVDVLFTDLLVEEKFRKEKQMGQK